MAKEKAYHQVVVRRLPQAQTGGGQGTAPFRSPQPQPQAFSTFGGKSLRSVATLDTMASSAAHDGTLLSSTMLTPLPKKKFAYYSPSYPRFVDAQIPEEKEGEEVELHVKKTRVKRMDMKKEISAEKRLVQNEQYKTEVQTKLRLQQRKQELERQKKFRSNYTSYSTSFARSTNTSSMAYNRNKPRNTVRVIRQLREKHRVENVDLAQGLRRELRTNLSHSKARLRESKLKLAEAQRKEDLENEHIVSESRIKEQEEITSTVQGQKMVHDVLSSLVQSDLNFAKRFQNLNNMLYSQVRQQRQKIHRKNNVKSNKERVDREMQRTKKAHEKAKQMLTNRLAKRKEETEAEQQQINETLAVRKERNRRRDMAIKSRMKHDFDLHQSLNPEAFVQRMDSREGDGKEKTIPWAGATSRRMDVFLDQTNKKVLPLTQIVSANEAMEDDDFFDSEEEEEA